MRLAGGYLRHEPVRISALVAGIAIAAAAFTLLCMNAAALTVQIHGQLPVGLPRRAYDILVRVPSRVSQATGTVAQARPTGLADLTGGITLAQYNAIRRQPGVEVAAPMTMVGYVPLTIVIPVALPTGAITAEPDLFTITIRRRSDDGLTSVTQRDAGSTFVSADRTAPPVCAATAHATPGSGGLQLATCWSAVTGPQPQAWDGPPPALVSVPLEWTFLLPLVAVDPAAEAVLLHLDRAVVRGRYLPMTISRPGSVPVIMASSIADDAQDDVSLDRVPASVVSSFPGALSAMQVRALVGTTTGQVIATSTVTASQAYAALLAYLRGPAVARVPAYWTTSPASYRAGPGGTLIPQLVPGDAGFRALRLHVARSRAGPGRSMAGLAAGVALQAVGEFDPARLVSSAATPSPYRGEQLSAADARSRRLLGGATLGPDGYPSPGATLVMPLQDLSAFTGAGAYTGTDARAPIGSIRIRVAGATGGDGLSMERVRVVAQEIVRATGLAVDVTLAASAAQRTIDLAAGRDGRPALQLREVWYRSDPSVTVSTALDPSSVALSASVLVVGSAFAASSLMATLGRRRRDLATLRALGWRRRRAAWHLGREFALIAAAAAGVGLILTFAVQAVVIRRLPDGWPSLSVPAALAMTAGAAWWQARRATAPAALTARALRAGSALPSGPPSGLVRVARAVQRAPSRTALGALVIVVACAALGLELAVRWVFGGVIVGSWFGWAVSWQDAPVDLAAVLILLAQATITIADISWRNSGERAAELRTLRAIGWPAHGLARLAVGEALLVGIAGAMAASVFDVVAIVAVVHAVPAGLVLVGAAVIAAGAAMSLLGAGLCAAVGRATRPGARPERVT